MLELIDVEEPKTANDLGGQNQRFVRLLKCGKQTCSHVLTEGEQENTPDPERSYVSIHTCPKCGNDDFWMLDKNGLTVNKSEEINVNDIDPSPRLGLKMKRRILAAKKRASA